jgi:hypothetical protein
MIGHTIARNNQNQLLQIAGPVVSWRRTFHLCQQKERPTDEQAGLAVRLEARILPDGQVKSLKDFVAKVAPGLDVAEADFETRRGVIEALNMQALLTVEDGQRTVHAWCVVGDKVHTLRPVERVL